MTNTQVFLLGLAVIVPVIYFVHRQFELLSREMKAEIHQATAHLREEIAALRIALEAREERRP